jgi:probable rRNA maturation factor
MTGESFTLNSTIANYPKYPYQEIKEAILGKKYQLSLAFVGTKRARAINLQSRNKDYSPNVLSFPLDENMGEIFICPEVAYGKAKDYGFSKDGYIAFLFIHGLLHLKGYDHSDKMEGLEKRYIKRFSIV